MHEEARRRLRKTVNHLLNLLPQHPFSHYSFEQIFLTVLDILIFPKCTEVLKLQSGRVLKRKVYYISCLHLNISLKNVTAEISFAPTEHIFTATVTAKNTSAIVSGICEYKQQRKYQKFPKFLSFLDAVS